MLNNWFFLFSFLCLVACAPPEQPKTQREFVETLPDIDDSLGADRESLKTSDLAPTVFVDQDVGLHSNNISVEITCEQNGDFPCDKISYTINDSDPTFNGVGTIVNADTSVVEIGEGDGSYSLKIVGQSSSGKSSAVRTFNFQIDSTGPENTILPVGGDYFSPQELEIRCDGCTKISYTLDGSEPVFDGSSFVEDSDNLSFRIGENQGVVTVKFRSIDAAENMSEVMTATYDIKFRCSGNEISSSGFEPCSYTCHDSGEHFEYSANNNNTECSCVYSHLWNVDIGKCKVKNEIINLLVGE